MKVTLETGGVGFERRSLMKAPVQLHNGNFMERLEYPFKGLESYLYLKVIIFFFCFLVILCFSIVHQSQTSTKGPQAHLFILKMYIFKLTIIALCFKMANILFPEISDRCKFMQMLPEVKIDKSAGVRPHSEQTPVKNAGFNILLSGGSAFWLQQCKLQGCPPKADAQTGPQSTPPACIFTC